MKSFTEWLSEEFRFAKGRDQDYTACQYEVLVFSEKAPEDYELEGKTHGQMSHAIKHLIEFEPEFVKSVVSKVKETIKKQLKEKPHWFCKVWNVYNGFNDENGIEAVNKASDEAVLNTLDMINDKNQMKEKLLKLDASIKPFAVELENKYNELIDKKLSKAVNLDKTTLKGSDLLKKIKKSSVIQFSCTQRNGGSFTVAIDFTDASLIIGKGEDFGIVNTFYKFNNLNGSTNRKKISDEFFKKRLIPVNKEIETALKSL